MTIKAPTPTPAQSAAEAVAAAGAGVLPAPLPHGKRRAAVKTRGPGTRRKVATVATWVGLCVVTVAFTYPLIWLISASFKPRSDVFDNRLIPATFAPENYVKVFQDAPIALWLGNTVLVTVLAAVTVTLSSSMVAWGFAYYKFRGRNLLFGLVLGTMMLPGAVTMIPTFLIWNGLGMVGTLTPLWANNLFGSAFYIFLLRQFFLSLPRDLFEAAKLDGANNWKLFTRIALPLCRPALAVAFIFEFQASWTDLMRPLIYLRDESTFTIPRGLKAVLDQYGFGGNWHWETIVTASVITTIPMIVLFFIGQRHFVAGIATTGSKG